MNRYHNSEGKLLAPEEAPSHEIWASITHAEKVAWKGTFWETLFTTMEWGSGFPPEARITSYLRAPHKLFAKSLPAGAYSIFYIETNRTWWKADIRFSVNPGQITYIGSLQCNFHDRKKKEKTWPGWGGKKGISCQVMITDNLDKDRELFEKNFRIFNSDLDWKITTRLMEGKIWGTREKQEKTSLHSIEKQYEKEKKHSSPQAAPNIHVSPSA